MWISRLVQNTLIITKQVYLVSIIIVTCIVTLLLPSFCPKIEFIFVCASSWLQNSANTEITYVRGFALIGVVA
jgi:hypothetical protein